MRDRDVVVDRDREVVQDNGRAADEPLTAEPVTADASDDDVDRPHHDRETVR